MKKFLLMFLVLTLVASLAWSGGQKEKSGEKGPIYLRMYYPVGVAGALAKLMDEMVADFNKSQDNVTVESIFAGGYREAMEKAQTAHLAGKPPELAVLDAPTLYTLRDIDAIVPLDDYIAKEGGDSYVAECSLHLYSGKCCRTLSSIRSARSSSACPWPSFLRFRSTRRFV